MYKSFSMAILCSVSLAMQAGVGLATTILKNNHECCIDQLQVGDYVRSFDLSLQQFCCKLIDSKCYYSVLDYYQLLIGQDIKIKCSPEQEIYNFLDRCWVPVKSLYAGQLIVTLTGKWYITSCKRVSEQCKIVKLTVKETHAWYEPLSGMLMRDG